MLLIALLRTLWRLSYEDMGDWPALALACGLPPGKNGQPRILCPSQQWKRGQRAGAPLPEALFVLSVLTALRCRLIGARDLIIDSAPMLAWRRADPDAAFGHAPAQHPRPLLRGWSTIARQVALTYTATCSRALWGIEGHAGSRGSGTTTTLPSGIPVIFN